MVLIIRSKVFDVAYRTIKKYNMLESGDKVVVGVSGGPDSLCLLHLLNELKTDLDIDLYVAHVNHGLRGISADQDEKFVKECADSLKLPVFTKCLEIKRFAELNKMTIEEAGREARYSYFSSVLKQVGANKIAVGHNKQDRVETLLLNFIRGSGLEGLKGIDPIRDNIIRPLIEIGRQEIELYCKENELAPRVDESNKETNYARNKIRLNLIPYLQENYNSNIIEALSRTIQLIYDENNFLSNLTTEYYEHCLKEFTESEVILKLEKFNLLDQAMKRRVLRLAIQQVKGDVRTVEKVHIEQGIELAQRGKTGTRFELPKGLKIKVEYSELKVELKQDDPELNYLYVIPIEGEVEMPEIGATITSSLLSADKIGSIDKSAYICILDREKIRGNIVVRNRRKGDIINLSGMKGTKKLKEYFINEKIPRGERKCIPLVAIGNEVIWIIGRRFSEKYKVSKYTKEVLVLEYGIKE